MFLVRMAECLEITVVARIAEFRNKKVSAVTWISLSIKFVVLRRQEKKERWANLTVACHRHPTEKG